MATKIYGVGMEDVQKLRQFYFLLMKRKFVKPFDRMACVDIVQIKGGNMVNPQIVRLAVVDTTIRLDDGSIIITKSRIIKIEKDIINQVTIKMNTPLMGSSAISLYFTNNTKKQDFLDAVGEIEPYASDDSSNNDQTPPNSGESSCDEVEGAPPN